MTQRDDTVYLRHILEAMGLIEEYLAGIDYAAFSKTRLVQDGVIRQFEIIGEATKNLSRQVRDMAPDVPWKNMAGMRDKLSHQYFGVDMQAVWMTARQDLPAVRHAIEELLGGMES
jgi:uncharacterized protein with HEPN domain